MRAVAGPVGWDARAIHGEPLVPWLGRPAGDHRAGSLAPRSSGRTRRPSAGWLTRCLEEVGLRSRASTGWSRWPTPAIQADMENSPFRKTGNTSTRPRLARRIGPLARDPFSRDFPVFFQWIRDFGRRDGFAPDCAHRRRLSPPRRALGRLLRQAQLGGVPRGATR